MFALIEVLRFSVSIENTALTPHHELLELGQIVLKLKRSSQGSWAKANPFCKLLQDDFLETYDTNLGNLFAHFYMARNYTNLQLFRVSLGKFGRVERRI